MRTAWESSDRTDMATSIFGIFSNTLSPILLGAFLSFPLFGMTIAQTIWYFRRYPEDSTTLKSLIASLFFIDTIQTFATAEASMTIFIRQKISLDYPLGILLHLFFTTVSVAIVRGIYTYRVWIMSEKNRPLLSILILLITCQLVTGIAFDTLQEVQGDASHLHIRVNDILGALSMGNGMACDILISISLVYYLNKWRSEVRRTENIIDRIIVYAAGVGVVTSVFSSLIFITWLALPHQFIFMLFFSIHSKLHVNSFLVTLNARSGLRNKDSSRSEYEDLELYDATKLS
ncbi:hypothetical protein BDN71DRAFT_1591196 [Pleurotus eryngii]|uniref:DUF6534 domain-containing protein n=1 Tax=Pleurotus eryngii TaxID=5323 RepID=A0A9P5ZTA1_PLEER|nr:hypothetical protein BDN71DRAFT_1591196 [Pleurotus eryngii]